jgi:hypothetical protein
MAALGMPNFGPEFSGESARTTAATGLGDRSSSGTPRRRELVVQITDFIRRHARSISPLIEAEDSGAYAAENNITPRDCN